MTVPRASAQKTDMQRLVVHVETRPDDAVPQASQPLAAFSSQNVGTLLSAEFKLEAVRRCREQRAVGVSAAHIARELEVRPDILRRCSARA